MQKYHMNNPRGLYKGLNTSVQKFWERFNDINCHLLYLPEEDPKQLEQDEFINFWIKLRLLSVMKQWLHANIKTFEMSYDELVSLS
jgi:hypothetical protein